MTADNDLPASPSPSDRPSPPPLPSRVAEPDVSDEAILRATGRGWDDWLRILDARGIDGFSHRATAAWLRGEQGVDSWWAQAITVGYERARGLRAVHQAADGFSVTVSKTMALPAERIWEAFADEEGRSRWLEPGFLILRTASSGRTARFDVAGGSTRVTLGLTAKGDAKTSVAIGHERLASADQVEERRAFWRDRLAALAELVAGDPRAPAAPRRSAGAPRRSAAETPAATPLDDYVVGVDPAKAPLVIELDRLVRAAAPELDAAVKYRMLTYALDGDWWRWVVAIGVTKQAVNLRLLYGTRLESGIGVLRPGSSHLATFDIAPGARPDAALVTRLVREAVERHPAFLAPERGAGG